MAAPLLGSGRVRLRAGGRYVAGGPSAHQGVSSQMQGPELHRDAFAPERACVHDATGFSGPGQATLPGLSLKSRRSPGSRGIMISLECSRDRVISAASRSMIWRRLMASLAVGP